MITIICTRTIGVINPRVLHSFPTRRSSDLEGFSAHGFAREALAHYENLTSFYPDTPQGAVARNRLEDCRNRTVLGDRKSTRLNSSHVSISYAVFCLKKKIRFSRTMYVLLLI